MTQKVICPEILIFSESTIVVWFSNHKIVSFNKLKCREDEGLTKQWGFPSVAVVKNLPVN